VVVGSTLKVHLEKRGNCAAVFAPDQFPGLLNLLLRRFCLRPNFTSRAFAAFTPARVRSLIRLRSSSARWLSVFWTFGEDARI
jgi:hypothetical protein